MFIGEQERTILLQTVDRIMNGELNYPSQQTEYTSIMEYLDKLTFKLSKNVNPKKNKNEIAELERFCKKKIVSGYVVSAWSRFSQVFYSRALEGEDRIKAWEKFCVEDILVMTKMIY